MLDQLDLMSLKDCKVARRNIHDHNPKGNRLDWRNNEVDNFRMEGRSFIQTKERRFEDSVNHTSGVHCES